MYLLVIYARTHLNRTAPLQTLATALINYSSELQHLPTTLNYRTQLQNSTTELNYRIHVQHSPTAMNYSSPTAPSYSTQLQS